MKKFNLKEIGKAGKQTFFVEDAESGSQADTNSDASLDSIEDATKADPNMFMNADKLKFENNYDINEESN